MRNQIVSTFSSVLSVLGFSLISMLAGNATYAQESSQRTNSNSSINLIGSNPGMPDDQKLPCEALICLSSPQGQSTSECNPAISAFNSIHDIDWSGTLQDRLDWLDKCPAASENQDMKNLAAAIVNGSMGCDAATLNRTLVHNEGQSGDAGNAISVIGNNMPGYCQAYAGNPYIHAGGTVLPVYVGTPETGGFWTDPANLQAAQAQYQAKLDAMRAAELQNDRNTGGN